MRTDKEKAVDMAVGLGLTGILYIYYRFWLRHLFAMLSNTVILTFLGFVIFVVYYVMGFVNGELYHPLDYFLYIAMLAIFFPFFVFIWAVDLLVFIVDLVEALFIWIASVFDVISNWDVIAYEWVVSVINYVIQFFV